MAIKQAEQRITALYERLSRDDELVGESNSPALLTDYFLSLLTSFLHHLLISARVLALYCLDGVFALSLSYLLPTFLRCLHCGCTRLPAAQTIIIAVALA